MADHDAAVFDAPPGGRPGLPAEGCADRAEPRRGRSGRGRGRGDLRAGRGPPAHGVLRGHAGESPGIPELSEREREISRAASPGDVEPADRRPARDLAQDSPQSHLEHLPASSRSAIGRRPSCVPGRRGWAGRAAGRRPGGRHRCPGPIGTPAPRRWAGRRPSVEGAAGTGARPSHREGPLHSAARRNGALTRHGPRRSSRFDLRRPPGSSRCSWRGSASSTGRRLLRPTANVRPRDRNG